MKAFFQKKLHSVKSSVSVWYFRETQSPVWVAFSKWEDESDRDGINGVDRDQHGGAEQEGEGGKRSKAQWGVGI